MNLSDKIRLIGFYHEKKQIIAEEQIRKEEANLLAELLDKSFSKIDLNVDTPFTTALKSNGVFIFKDVKCNLYAYSPHDHIVQITEVCYNKKIINEVDLSYKGWFVPGQPFIIGSIPINEVDFCNLSGEWTSFKLDKDPVYKSWNDYYIKLGKSTYAINYQDTVSIAELKKLILHKWVCLEERNMQSECGNCDGWDYSGCDMDRCRDDCDGCGGRRYKCNNSCFKFRHKVAVTICYCSNIIKEDLSEGFKLLDEIGKPHSIAADNLWKQYQSLCKSLLKDCYFIQRHFENIEVVNTFIKRYSSTSLLQTKRHEKSPTITITFNNHDPYLISSKDVSIEVEYSGFFWKNKYGILSLNGYDSNSDTFVEIKIKLKELKNKETIENLISSHKSNTLKSIRLTKDTNNSDFHTFTFK